jgi:hypothetical protein
MGRSSKLNKTSAISGLTRSRSWSEKKISALSLGDKKFLKLADDLKDARLKNNILKGKEFNKAEAKIQLINLLIEKAAQENPPQFAANILKRAEKKTGLIGKKALLKLRYLENIEQLEKSDNQSLKDLGYVLKSSSDQKENLLFLNEVIESALLTGKNELIQKTTSSLRAIEEETRNQATIERRPETKVTIVPSFRFVSEARNSGCASSGVNLTLENGERLIFLSAEEGINQANNTQSPEIPSQIIDDLSFPSQDVYLRKALQETLRHELIHSSQIEHSAELSPKDESLREGLTEALNIALRKGWAKSRYYPREVQSIEEVLKPRVQDEKEYLKLLKKLNTMPIQEAKAFLQIT